MKLGIFTDSHYSSQEVTCGNRYNSKSLAKIREAVSFFEAEGCDLAVCLGDLIDREADHGKEQANLWEAGSVFAASPLRVVCVMGNHDGFAFTQEEFYAILGKRCLPETVYAEGKTLIFLDACYLTSGRHYAPGDHDWEDTFLPDTEGLKNALSAAKGEVYIFLHQNLDPNIPENHAVKNRAEVLQILKENGRVKAVFQGHYHPGTECLWEGIRFCTFPAMCERDGARFVLEI